MQDVDALLTTLAPEKPVLIAGPTASGKSALALAIAARQGGVVVNADALQVFSDWRVLTARPSAADLARAPHALYGHVPGDRPYSAGDWLREVAPLLRSGARPIITGGTGLYFSALTEGLAQIPAIPEQVRAEGDALRASGLGQMIKALDAETQSRLDLANPMRVQRAWEVQRATGQGLAAWQDATPPPMLPLAACHPIVLDAPKAWLTPRIEMRFRQMIDAGALDEARANRPDWHPALPSAKAIGAAELMAYLDGTMTLEAAIQRATILTRQYAKRQRTWFRARMSAWQAIPAKEAA